MTGTRTLGVVLALDDLTTFLVEKGGSDLHVKAFAAPHLRVDGLLRATELPAPTVTDLEQLVASMLPGDRSKLLADTGQVDFALGVPKVGRFRVHVVRQRGSLSLVLRHVIPGTPKLDVLGLPPVVARLAEETQGLVLVTGPRSSGTTTTIAAMVDHINESRAVSIITIEDPIEILHPDKKAMVMQREVGTDTSSYAEGLAGIMRHDPDVLYVGELVDPETTWQAITAASTGLLVISTLRTTTTSETVARIIEMYPPHQQRQVRRTLATALKGIVSQRLLDRADGQGRVPAVEALVMTNRVFDRVIDPEADLAFEELMADGEYYGMQTFDQSLLELYRQGLIGLRDAMAAATHPKELRVSLQSAGLVHG